MKSGWPLIPAFLFGLAAVIQIVRGSNADSQTALLPKIAILVGGAAAYAVLLAATSILLKRQVTTELFLIVGWTMPLFLEVNGLFALRQYSKTTAVIVFVFTVIAAVVSLVYYLLYYKPGQCEGVYGRHDTAASGRRDDDCSRSQRGLLKITQLNRLPADGGIQCSGYGAF